MDLFNKKKLENKDREIKILNDNFERINGELLTYKKLYKEKLNDENITNLIAENQKLIEWTEKIINEVGVQTKDSYEGLPITIPYYEKTKPYYIEGDWNKTSMKQKDVIIPSIRYTKIN